MDEPGLGALELAVGLAQLAVRLLELRRALAHAVLQTGVQQGQRLVRARVLERGRRLLGEGAQELGVAGRVEEPRALGARGEDAHQLAAQAKRQGDLRAERGERRAHRLVRRRVGVDLGGVVDRDDPALVEGAAERRRHAPAVAGFSEAAVGLAHEEAGDSIGNRMLDRRTHESDDALPLERRGQLATDRGQLACAVVGGAEEDAVDERLEAGAERVEDEEDGEREEDGEGRRGGQRVAVQHHVQQDDGADVRGGDGAAQHEVVGAPLHHGVDLEEVVLHDGVGEGEAEENLGEGTRVHREATTGEDRHQNDRSRNREPAERPEGHHADPLAREGRSALPVLPHQAHSEEYANQAEVCHVGVEDRRVRPGQVKEALVQRADREGW